MHASSHVHSCYTVVVPMCAGCGWSQSSGVVARQLQPPPQSSMLACTQTVNLSRQQRQLHMWVCLAREELFQTPVIARGLLPQHL